MLFGVVIDRVALDTTVDKLAVCVWRRARVIVGSRETDGDLLSVRDVEAPPRDTVRDDDVVFDDVILAAETVVVVEKDTDGVTADFVGTVLMDGVRDNVMERVADAAVVGE